MQCVLPPSKIWTNADGTVVDTIKVFFYNDPLDNTHFEGEPMTNERIIDLVNDHWNCHEEAAKLDESFRVPTFEEDSEEQSANVRIKYEKSKSQKIIPDLSI